MLKVSCPNCGVRLTASNELVGQPVNCQKCNTKFVLSTRWMNEPIVPGAASDSQPDQRSDEKPPPPRQSDSNWPALEATAVDPTRITIRERSGSWLDNYSEARSVADFFDFRFHRYLTPWIVRISWMIVLLLAVGWGLLISYAYVSSLLDNSGQGAEVSNAFGSADRPGNVFGSPFFLKTGVFLTGMTAVLLSVLWIRVLFELIILGFSIGNSLRAIRERDA